jgi:hypothetical protein
MALAVAVFVAALAVIATERNDRTKVVLLVGMMIRVRILLGSRSGLGLRGCPA